MAYDTNLFEGKVVMRKIYLAMNSFADMTPERLLAIGRAFDRHPILRPWKVGGDPARIKVDPSMEAIFNKQELPVTWLTVRRTDQSPNFEGGQIDLYPGRGGWIGYQENGEWQNHLIGHTIEQCWGPKTMGETGICEDIVSLFEDLIETMDPAYACVSDRPFKQFSRFALPGVFWLNYFGPAFLKVSPDLASIANARLMVPGGVLIQTAEHPWVEKNSMLRETRKALYKILGKQAFIRRKQSPSPMLPRKMRPSSPMLPTPQDHVAASPGTDEMPWVTMQAQKDSGARRKKHAKAQEKLSVALADRQEMMLDTSAVEWSTSMDLPDWPAFATFLGKKLKGDFSTPIAKALIDVIATADVNDEGNVMLDTLYGVLKLDWFIDDETTLDLSIHGPVMVEKLCDEWFKGLQ
ncbi:MAG: hypothetical protein FWH57_12100 [Oscillospiraceae bacterium]|nr:hypothetical protein [Oscillospiraceae bacterium]